MKYRKKMAVCIAVLLAAIGFSGCGEITEEGISFVTEENIVQTTVESAEEVVTEIAAETSAVETVTLESATEAVASVGIATNEVYYAQDAAGIYELTLDHDADVSYISVVHKNADQIDRMMYCPIDQIENQVYDCSNCTTYAGNGENRSVIETAYHATVTFLEENTVLWKADIAPYELTFSKTMPVTTSAKTTESQQTEVSVIATPMAGANDAVGVSLIHMSIPDIIAQMGGVYEIETDMIDTFFCFYNNDVFPGMEFYFRFYDSYSSADDFRPLLESGEISLEAIQINAWGASLGTPAIASDFTYQQCASVLGEITCQPGTGALLGGDIGSECYQYVENNARVMLHFACYPGYADAVNQGGGDASFAVMSEQNPQLKCIVIDLETDHPSLVNFQ